MPKVGTQTDLKDELALELWREGRTGEARELLRGSLSLSEGDELVALACHVAMAEHAEGDYTGSLRTLLSIESHASKCEDAELSAKYWNGIATAYIDLSEREESTELFRCALSAVETSKRYYKAAGLHDRIGIIENNTGVLLCNRGRFSEAHQYFDRATEIYTDNPIRLAEVNLSRAETYLKEGRLHDAHWYAIEAAYHFRSEPRLLKLANKVLAQVLNLLERESEIDSIRAALIGEGSVAKAAHKLGWTRQGLEDKLKRNYPWLEQYAVRRKRL